MEQIVDILSQIDVNLDVNLTIISFCLAGIFGALIIIAVNSFHRK